MTRKTLTRKVFLMNETASTAATPDRFEVDAVFGGMVRVTLFRNGRMVNRRRDVSPERVEEIKATLLREVS